MKTPRGLVIMVTAAAVAAACSKDPPPGGAGPTPSSAPSSSAPAPASASAGASAPSATGSAAARPKRSGDAGASLSAADRAAFWKALEAGRKKSRAKEWKAALEAFDRALAVAPDDARVLAEVGWAALNAGDLDRAAAANKRALANAKTNGLRAQVLYNQGRVAEARKDAEAAKKAYAESLALRDNAEVKKRLESVGGAPVEAQLPCAAGGEKVEVLCTCLTGLKGEVMLFLDDKPACAAMPESLALGTSRLSVVRWGAPPESPGERVYTLAARDNGVLRPVAELGRDYMPGAMGIDNSATVNGGKVETFGKRSVVVVKSEQHDTDKNMAGLELCTNDVEQDTVCKLGEGTALTKCVVVPRSIKSGCGQGVEVDPGELDDETKAQIAELKKGWSTSSVKLDWVLTDDGKVDVKIKEGDAKLVAKGVVGSHPLF
ncbi:MAG: hypothetical protein JST00_22370 [Deltaproteobacteria bacterium]|nr:hypothetical protein [Deltaproteobacteria bacterium]